jgi:sugar phosphate isomerase/epimerase
MKYGIRDGMLREPLETMFTVAKEIGFDGIEYCIGGGYKESLLWQGDGPAKLKALADKDGMEISSLSPGVFSSLHPVVPDEEKRRRTRDADARDRDVSAAGYERDPRPHVPARLQRVAG